MRATTVVCVPHVAPRQRTSLGQAAGVAVHAWAAEPEHVHAWALMHAGCWTPIKRPYV